MVAQAVQRSAAGDIRLVPEIRGVVGRLFNGVSGEVIISGPAGTGKTRGILEYIHLRCSTGRTRVLMLRKTLESLKASALVTYQEQVLYKFDGKRSAYDGVTYFGGNKLVPAHFAYEATGSVIVVGGLDNPEKVKSSEWDIVYINEATELTVGEWEMVTGRTDRPSMFDKPPSLVVGDCNPDAPTHWVKQREADGQLQLWESRHEDNPAMWDRFLKQWTPSGLRYIARLDLLTGVRKLRLRFGKWVAAEGQIYEGWDAAIHLIDDFAIPPSWDRYWCIDFGFVNPFVWQWWAVDPDGRLYLYREIYHTQRLVTEHAEYGMTLTANDPKPKDVIADHDAEDRATFEKATKTKTKAANKTVSPGIQAVANRLKPEGDGRPRLYILRNARVEEDKSLRERGKPTSTAEEWDSYVWDVRQGRKKGEEPLKEDDHGMDGTRYTVAHFDLKKRGGSWGFN